jgi:hypothetical protein
VGSYLYSRDRLEVVDFIRQLCTIEGGISISLSLRMADDLGYANSALVILDVSGIGLPDSSSDSPISCPSGHITEGSESRWWWDKVYRINPAPALGEFHHDDVSSSRV